MKERNKNARKKIKMNGFSDRLKFAMQRRHISQLKLSQTLEVTQPLIHYWLKGSDLPRKYHAQKLAWALVVDYSWLITGRGEPFAFQVYPIETFWSDFAERLAYLLWTRNMNVMDLQAVVDKATVSMWLDKHRVPTVQDFKTLADFFVCPKDWLTNGHANITTEAELAEYKKWKTSNYELLFGADCARPTPKEKAPPILKGKQDPVIEQGQRYDLSVTERNIKRNFPAAYLQLATADLSQSFLERALDLLRSNNIMLNFYRATNSKKYPNTYTAKILIDSPEKVKQLKRRSPSISYPYRSSLNAAIKKGLYKSFEILNALLIGRAMQEKTRSHSANAKNE
jgi:transcriptional regulator with XRE-family HTH domain